MVEVGRGASMCYSWLGSVLGGIFLPPVIHAAGVTPAELPVELVAFVGGGFGGILLGHALLRLALGAGALEGLVAAGWAGVAHGTVYGLGAGGGGYLALLTGNAIHPHPLVVAAVGATGGLLVGEVLRYSIATGITSR